MIVESGNKGEMMRAKSTESTDLSFAISVLFIKSTESSD